MNPWPFVVGAYAFTAAATLGLIWHSFASMRRAEAEADALRGER
jgi:Heme exporter protein D (CcmD)